MWLTFVKNIKTADWQWQLQFILNRWIASVTSATAITTTAATTPEQEMVKLEEFRIWRTLQTTSMSNLVIQPWLRLLKCLLLHGKRMFDEIERCSFCFRNCILVLEQKQKKSICFWFYPTFEWQIKAYYI